MPPFNVSKRDFLINLGVLFFSVLIFFLALEMVLRLGGVGKAGGTLKFCGNHSKRATFHPKYGWTETSGGEYLEKRTGADDWSLHEINERGFRDTFNSGKENIIVLGDSITEGYLVDQNSTFTHLLDRWTPETSFRSYGVPAYGTSNELMVYKNVSEKFEHSLVILVYYPGNDILDNVDGRRKRPEFALEDGKLVLEQLPKNKSSSEKSNILEGVLKKVKGFLAKNTATYTFLRPKITKVMFMMGWGKISGKEIEEEVELTRALVEEISNVAKDNNANLLIVIMPEYSEIHPEKMRYRRFRGMSYLQIQREMLSNITESRINTKLIDMKPYFKEKIAKGDRLYGKIDTHPDDLGHRVVARVIYKKLVKGGYLENNTKIDFSKDYSKNITECPR